jgi:cytochrome c oxidase subunit 3
VLYLNTLSIIASSITLEIARRRIASFMGGARDKGGENPARWLYITLFLGLLFVAGQTFAWLQLKAQGFGLATNISYSFFYVLTVAHALHVFGGLGGLVRVIAKLNKSVLRRSTLDATSRYWHFMGVLWLYLFLLLWMKL